MADLLDVEIVGPRTYYAPVLCANIGLSFRGYGLSSEKAVLAWIARSIAAQSVPASVSVPWSGHAVGCGMTPVGAPREQRVVDRSKMPADACSNLLRQHTPAI